MQERGLICRWIISVKVLRILVSILYFFTNYLLNFYFMLMTITCFVLLACNLLRTRDCFIVYFQARFNLLLMSITVQMCSGLILLLLFYAIFGSLKCYRFSSSRRNSLRLS